MKSAALSFLRVLLTEADNASWDIVRLASALGVLTFLGLSIANWRHFDPLAFGGGFSAVLLAAGGGLRIKDGATNPEPAAATTNVNIKAGTATVNSPGAPNE